MHLLLPKTKAYPHEIGDRNLFYVAGPIRGADDWQLSAYRKLRAEDDTCVIATPSRHEPEALNGFDLFPGVPNFYDRQTDWEDEYMKQAAWYAPHGCLMFWLPLESVRNPRPKEDGPYAQDSYGELGYWRAVLDLLYLFGGPIPRPNVVIGAEEGFHGLRKYRRDMDRIADTFPIYGTLTETVIAASQMATKGR